MECQAHIDAKYDQQFESSLRESRQDDEGENNVCANARRIREDMECQTHIDAKNDQQFGKSLLRLRQDDEDENDV
jgi:hypothetical protein